MSKNLQGATLLQLNDTDVLVVHMPNTNRYSSQKWSKHMADTKKKLKDLFPNTPIIVSAYEINFTTVSRKQTFFGKLLGRRK